MRDEDLADLLDALDDALDGTITVAENTRRVQAWRACFAAMNGCQPTRAEFALWLIGEGIGVTLLRADEPPPTPDCVRAYLEEAGGLTPASAVVSMLFDKYPDSLGPDSTFRASTPSRDKPS